MASLFRLFILLSLVAALLTLKTQALAVRDTVSDISSTKGGILVKNGKQTSCELGVIDSTAAFVAASCLDYSGNSVNENTNYQVYLDTGIDNTPAKYTVSSITVHPEYNATISLNPIAVLQFNKGSTEKWSNPIAIDRNNSWGDIAFVRRGLTDVGSMKWKTPLTVTNKYSNVAECDSDTRVFEANENDLFCSNATTYPPYTYLTGCAIPYGSVEVYISGKAYVAGIHAYTSVSVTGYNCTLRNFQDSIYVLFADYIAFASKVLGRSISYYPNSGDSSPQSNPDYSMKAPDYLLSYRTIKSGDFYASQSDAPSDNSSPSATESDDQSQISSDSAIDGLSSDRGSDTAGDNGSEALSATSNDIGGSSSDNQDNESKKTAIIGVVCGILGGIILTCIALLFYRKWKKSHKNIYRDKNTQIDMQSMLVVDANNLSSPGSILMHSGLTPKPTVQPPSTTFGRDHFEMLDYDLPPLYEPNAPTSAETIITTTTAAATTSGQQHHHP
ncbi:hypothetical protein EV178_004566 [Coemansia sp. RSA 1646]|nr:hypothetical protein EV178_004566 [Coemansia sp. RSA 1646]KAJ2214194.1 hypothetical protein EV179_003214 [Coemansia sp. RSA 487]